MKTLNVVLKSISFLFLLTISTSVSAQADYFLKIEGIEGESRTDDHKKWIDILSWSWGAMNSEKNVVPRANRNHNFYDPIIIRKQIDKSSPLIQSFKKRGQLIPDVIMTVKNQTPKGTEYYKVIFSDVIVTSYRTSGASHSADRPTEEVAFYYNKIEFEYYDPFGGVKTIFKGNR